MTLVKQFLKLTASGNYSKALEISRQIISTDPYEAHYFYNHYLVCKELELTQEAINALIKAKEKMPNCPVIRTLLANMLLDTGKFQEGLAEKEWRFKWPLKNSPCPTTPLILEYLPKLFSSYRQPYWNGEPCPNKTILVFNEAGYGDLIQNIRYLPILKEKSKAKIVLEVKPELYTLLKNCKGIDEFTLCNQEKRLQKFFKTYADQKDDDLPTHDYILSCESLHHFLNPNLDHIPLETPYIWPEPKEFNLPNNDKTNIAIAWAGNKADPADRYRSCPVKHFKHLNSIENVQLFSIQKGDMQRIWPELDGQMSINIDLAEGLEDCNIVDISGLINDFNDTANILLKMDILVAVDTSVVHLAGALEVPTFVILPEKYKDWRWQKQWYKSVYPFPFRDNWEQTLNNLAKFIEER